MKFFAKVGKSEQIIDETRSPECPEGYVEMKEERPSSKHIAAVSGEWILPEPQPEVTANETDNPENAS